MGAPLHHDRQRTLGAIGFDDQIVRLFATRQGHGQTREHFTVETGVLPDQELGAFSSTTAVAQSHSDRHARAGTRLTGRVHILNRHITRDLLVAQRHDVNRHSQIAIGSRRPG